MRIVRETDRCGGAACEGGRWRATLPVLPIPPVFVSWHVDVDKRDGDQEKCSRRDKCVIDAAREEQQRMFPDATPIPLPPRDSSD